MASQSSCSTGTVEKATAALDWPVQSALEGLRCCVSNPTHSQQEETASCSFQSVESLPSHHSCCTRANHE